MAYLSRLRKEELKFICDELGESISDNVKIPEMKNIILESSNYDEDLVKGMTENLIEDRKLKQELEIEDRKLKEEERKLKEQERKREHELELKRLEIAAKVSVSEDSLATKELPTPRVDWQSQLPKFGFQNEDISLYLVHFERIMKRVQIPESLWMSCLIIKLPTDIVQMIMREPEEQSENYEYVKALLLKRYKLSPEKFRQMFFAHRNSGEKSWREFYHELETYFNGWITGLKVDTFNGLKNLIIAEQMKRKTPNEIREHYLDQWSKLISPVELSEKIDEYVALRNVVKRKTVFSAAPQDKENKFKTVKEENSIKRELNGRHLASHDACYNCYEKGHFSRNCTKPKRQKYCTKCKTEGHGTKDCVEHANKRPSSLCISNITTSQRSYKLVNIDGLNSISSILDTGSNVSLIKLKLASALNKVIEDQTPDNLKGIGGNLKPYGVVCCNVVVDGLELNSIRFLVVPDDTFSGPDILIGTNVIDLPSVAMIRKQGQSMLVNNNCEFLQDFNLDNDFCHKTTLKSKNAVVIEPHSVQLINSITDDTHFNSFIIETQNRQHNEIYVRDGMTCVPVINSTNSKICIKENQVIIRGDAIPVETLDDVSKDNEDSNIHFVDKLPISREPLSLSQIKVGPQVTKSEAQQLCNLLNEFRDCIALKNNELGCIKNTTMKIIEVPGSKPISHTPYRASYHEREVLRKIVSELKQQGVIQDSTSNYSSPVLLVKKKTGDYRMVIDYRRLNSQCLKDKFLLPCIDDLLDRLTGYNIFSILDAAQGFNQIPLHPESMHKAAFITPDGHFEPTRLFFGLTNGPAVFQRAMTLALGDLLWNVVTCFVDDMLIGAKTFDDMMMRLRCVLMKLRDAGVTLKLSKCEFAMNEIEYLGFQISSKGIQPGPRKLAAISEFPAPRNVKELRRFLGLSSFFRRFIERYAMITSPLNKLLKKDAIFEWNSEHQNVFEELKQRLITKPVLKLYDYRDETELHTDASSVGLAGMLLQYDKNKKLRLVYCVSRRTSPDEAGYHSSRLELIAAVWSMTRLRPLLIGKHFTLVTDCSAITFLNTQRNVKPQIARWAELLSEFDFEVKHRAGDKMCHVDALSRAPVEERNRTPEEEFDLTSPVELTDSPKVFYISTEQDRVALIQAQDSELQKIIVILKKPANKRTRLEKQLVNNYELKDGILYRIHDIGDKKLFVMPKSMRKYLTVRFHDFSGHYGAEKVATMIRHQFWFPHMTNYIKQHIKQCVVCAFTKVPSGKQQGKLNPIPPGKRPFEIIHMDFLGPFVTSSCRNRELLVIVDNLTKFVRLRSCSTKCVLKYFDEFTNDFGAPYRIITDRGTCFTSAAFEDYCKMYGIKHTLICSQRPQANGQVERINRVLIPMISSLVQKESHKDWDQTLPEVQRCINWTPSKSTGKSPFELLYGYQPIKPGYFPSELLPTSNDYTSPEELRKEAQEELSKAQSKMKSHYDSHRSNACKYAIGDVVVVKRLPEHTGNSTKTQAKYRGPLVVMKVLPSDTYQLTDLRTYGQGRKRRQNYTTTAHASQMKLFHIVDEDSIADEENDSDKIAYESSHTVHEAKTDDSQDVSTGRPRRKRELPSYLQDYKLYT